MSDERRLVDDVVDGLLMGAEVARRTDPEPEPEHTRADPTKGAPHA